uniref:DUF4806 domain-containing protein n=1 Tax=Megaselia scalaris TaxID=36166 RepID=T1GC32_MEGSC
MDDLEIQIAPDSNLFAVIRTVEKGKFNYSTVLMKWLYSTEDGRYLVKWPQHYERAIKEKASPTNIWQTFLCSIKARNIDSKLAAKNVEKTYYEDGSTDSQQEKQNRKILKRRHPVTTLGFDENSNYNESQVIYPNINEHGSTEEPHYEKENNESNLEPVPHLDNSQNENVYSDYNQVLESNFKDFRIAFRTFIWFYFQKSNDANIQSILKMCKTIVKVTTQLHIDMEKLSKKIESFSVPNIENCETVFKFPLKKKKQINEFEVSLENEETFKRFVSWIKQIGGFDIDHYLLNVARNLFKDQVLKKYSLCGRKEKICFKNFKNILNAHVMGISQSLKTNMTLQDVHSFYGRYLKNAGSRLSQKDRKNQD